MCVVGKFFRSEHHRKVNFVTRVSCFPSSSLCCLKSLCDTSLMSEISSNYSKISLKTGELEKIVKIKQWKVYLSGFFNGEILANSNLLHYGADFLGLAVICISVLSYWNWRSSGLHFFFLVFSEQTGSHGLSSKYIRYLTWEHFVN